VSTTPARTATPRCRPALLLLLPLRVERRDSVLRFAIAAVLLQAHAMAARLMKGTAEQCPAIGGAYKGQMRGFQ